MKTITLYAKQSFVDINRFGGLLTNYRRALIFSKQAYYVDYFVLDSDLTLISF